MKQSIHAISFAPDAQGWLTNTFHPRILHVFHQACNLINERGDVVSIVTAEIGNGPFNLVIDDDVSFFKHVRVDSPVSMTDNQLTLGNLTINIGNAQLWNPCPDWEMLNAKRDQILNQIKQLLITTYLKNSSLSLPQSLLSSLSAALVNSDISTATSSASQLAGFGVGLTPSGDDFIMGALYAAWIIHPPEVASILALEIANAAAPLTTSLSAAWLRAAGKGEAGTVWHEFLDVLRSSDSARIRERLKNILAVGETSGADAMGGFLRIFEALMKR